ncbi:MAG: carboxypeptidase-like regulatory domain-containing protein [Terracidiphilus sp.]|nr:carboxypeptidase-like regulatory domain-containing protein [Terracidiphilus sp.]
MTFRTQYLRALILGASLSVGASIAILAPIPAAAQADLGSVNGIVTDSSGAVIANASITVKNAGTGAQRVTTTSGAGQYAVTQLPAADYTISVTAPGFATSTQKFTLTIGSTHSINVKLGVAGGQTEVLVTTDTSTVPDTVDGQVATNIGANQVQNLPVYDRNPYNLVSLSGNASSQIGGGDRGVGVDIGGARSASVDILLDGAENTDMFGVGVGQNIPQDAMQEFSVVVAGQGAEFGRASGGAVNVGTKSGTNQFHGDVFEYNRISTFASDSYNNNAKWATDGHDGLTSPKPRYVHNQLGYFIGGPIKRNKLFFASSTEWLRVRSSSYSTAEVPLPGLISQSASNMQDFFTAYGNLQYPVNGATYTGADIQNQGLWTSDITTIAEQQNGTTGTSCADPNLATAPICANALFGTVVYPVPGDSGGGTPVNQWISFNRVDWTVSDKTQVFGRYIQQSSDFFPGTNASSPYKGFNTGSSQKNHSLLISLTHTFSPSIASATKILAARYNGLQPLNGAPVPTLYPNSGSTVQLGEGTINFPGYLPTSPGSAIPFGGPQNFIQIGEDLTWSKGKHAFKFGGEFLFIKDNRVFGAYENAVDALVQTGTKKGLINFINGNLGYENVALNPNGVYPCKRDPGTNAYIYTSDCMIETPASAPNFSRSNRYQDGAAYFTDSWHATTQLTINAGLRWEIYGPQHSQKASNDANFFLGSGSTIYDQIRNGEVKTRETAPDGRLWKLNLKQFGPRIGVAYDVFGNGKSVVRAGYALSYERNFNNVTFNVIQNPPNYAVLALTNVAVTTANLGAFADNVGLKPLPNTTLRAVDPNIKQVYSQNWNATIEHQLDPTTMVTLGYVGSRGIHNYSIANINRQFSGANYLGDASGVSRLNLQYGNVNFRGSDGDSYYNAVNFGVRSSNIHRTGITTIANYTWGRSIDNNSSTFGDGTNAAGGGFYLGYLDPFNHELDRGPSDFNVAHRVTAGIVWEVPYFHTATGLRKAFFDGWIGSTTFTAQTGNPYTLYDCGYAYTVCPRASFTGSRPKKLSKLQDVSSIYGPNSYSYQNLPDYGGDGYNEWVNPNIGISDMPLAGAAGTGAGGFVVGMDGRNAYNGPGTWDEDLKLAKTVLFHEKYGINLSGTAINVFNHPNTHLNLNGVNDVSYTNYALAYKDGHRDIELEAKFIF